MRPVKRQADLSAALHALTLGWNDHTSWHTIQMVKMTDKIDTIFIRCKFIQSEAKGTEPLWCLLSSDVTVLNTHLRESPIYSSTMYSYLHRYIVRIWVYIWFCYILKPYWIRETLVKSQYELFTYSLITLHPKRTDMYNIQTSCFATQSNKPPLKSRHSWVITLHLIILHECFIFPCPNLDVGLANHC